MLNNLSLVFWGREDNFLLSKMKITKISEEIHLSVCCCLIHLSLFSVACKMTHEKLPFNIQGFYN